MWRSRCCSRPAAPDVAILATALCALVFAARLPAIERGDRARSLRTAAIGAGLAILLTAPLWLDVLQNASRYAQPGAPPGGHLQVAGLLGLFSPARFRRPEWHGPSSTRRGEPGRRCDGVGPVPRRHDSVPHAAWRLSAKAHVVRSVLDLGVGRGFAADAERAGARRATGVRSRLRHTWSDPVLDALRRDRARECRPRELLRSAVRAPIRRATHRRPDGGRSRRVAGGMLRVADDRRRHRGCTDRGEGLGDGSDPAPPISAASHRGGSHVCRRDVLPVALGRRTPFQAAARSSGTRGNHAVVRLRARCVRNPTRR